MPADLEPQLSWDDARLEVSSDPPIRSEYRRYQSWYREFRLGARYAVRGPGRRVAPVGTLLAGEEVARDRALNLLGEQQILAYADHRLSEVVGAGGTADRDRVFRNMLSSMPMAFALAAVLRDAPDCADIIGAAFGVDCAEVLELDAEWAPDDPQLRVGRTAFDVVVRYRTSAGRTGLLGIETKYTESPDKAYDGARFREMHDETACLHPGAADRLARVETNQLWRNALLAAAQLSAGLVDEAAMVVVGLEADEDLRHAVAEVQGAASQNPAFRVLGLPWERLIGGLRQTSLGWFGHQFNERYLDPGQMESVSRLEPVGRRSTVAAERDRRWLRHPTPTLPRPDRPAVGDDLWWNRWAPTVWRGLSDPARVLLMPSPPPAGQGWGCAWWMPLYHLMAYRLGWAHPVKGLLEWDRIGRPLEDDCLSLIECVWGRHLDLVVAHLSEPQNAMHFLLGSRTEPQPTIDLAVDWGGPAEAPAWFDAPVGAGSDPLHLGDHVGAPMEEGEPFRLREGDLGAPGPPRATLTGGSYRGWYRELGIAGGRLPTGAQDGWRVDVIVEPIGHLGTFRRSRSTGRWFAGQHRWHLLGH